jgi:hypothetical protein
MSDMLMKAIIIGMCEWRVFVEISRFPDDVADGPAFAQQS